MSHFPDHFSPLAKQYGAYRPTYPAALYEFLASLCPGHQLVWDCATGTGQAAAGLARHFQRVIATDAAAAQLSAAQPVDGVEFHVATAERSGLADHSVDLVTVAQALHWFDLPAFEREVARVMRKNGVLAVWSYDLVQVNPLVDELIHRLYHDTLAGCWPAQRKLVEDRYQGIRFGWPELEVPAFSMRQNWSLKELLGYLSTWSAVKQYRDQNGRDPLVAFQHKLQDVWAQEQGRIEVSWPLTLRAWRLPSESMDEPIDEPRGK